MEILKLIVGLIVGFAVLVLLAFALNYAGFLQFSFFAPRVTAVQNKVFQESQQYNEGMVRDLENIRRDYLTATPEQRLVLKALAIHRFEVYPEDKLPPDLAAFYRSLQ
jgi:hypothetical protein